MHQVLVFTQLEVLHLVGLPLPLLLQPLLRLHGTHASNLLVGLYPGLLEPLNGLLQLLAYPRVLPRQLDDPAEAVLGLYPQLAQFVVELIQFWVVGDVELRNFHLVFLAFVVDGDQTAVLPLFLHLLEDLNQKFELFLQLLGGAANQGRQFVGLFEDAFFSSVHAGNPSRPAGQDVDFPELYLIVDPLCNCLGIYLLLFLVEDGHDLLLGIGQIFVFLVGGVEVELAHLVRLEGDAEEVDDLDQLVHAEHVLGYFALVQSHKEQVQDVLFLILGREVSLVLEHWHQLSQLFGCQALHTPIIFIVRKQGCAMMGNNQ